MLSNKQRRNLIFALTVGGLLEWYEVLLYIYWAPILSKLFFNTHSPIAALINTLFIFALGFLSRFLGGVFFGHMGDRYGRKKSILISIVMLSIPAFIIGFLPTYEKIGPLAPILLAALRFLQGFPAGGELPTAMCYLYESAQEGRKRSLCSWTFFGAQLGAIFAIFECLLLEKSLSLSALASWGWRLSFIVGGLIGLFALFLRYRLLESPSFSHLAYEKRLSLKPVFETLSTEKKRMGIAFLLCILNEVGFYLICIFSGVYFQEVLQISPTKNLLLTAGLIALATFPLPLYGKLGDRFDNKILYVSSALGIILLSVPLYFAILHHSLVYVIFIEILMVLTLNIQFALLPYWLSVQFPTRIRLSSIGISFNLSSFFIGALTPVASLFLIQSTGNIASFCFLLSSGALLSLLAFLFVYKNQKIFVPKQMD